MSYATAKAYRIKGGAMVTITRADGTTRKHKVNNHRFRWLRSVFGLASCKGWFTSSGFDCELDKPIGEEYRWLRSQNWKA